MGSLHLCFYPRRVGGNFIKTDSHFPLKWLIPLLANNTFTVLNSLIIASQLMGCAEVLDNEVWNALGNCCVYSKHKLSYFHTQSNSTKVLFSLEQMKPCEIMQSKSAHYKGFAESISLIKESGLFHRTLI